MPFVRVRSDRGTQLDLLLERFTGASEAGDLFWSAKLVCEALKDCSWGDQDCHT